MTQPVLSLMPMEIRGARGIHRSLAYGSRMRDELLFFDVHLPTGERGWLRTAGTTIEGRGRLLLPGFIDVHVHGALGHEVMDGDVEGLFAHARFLAAHGVTSFLPTTWTGSREHTLAALESIAEAMRRPRPAGTARILGAHMEGPYLNPKRAGAQDPAFMRPPEPGELERYLDFGFVRLMTVAPELPANAPVLAELRR